MNFFSADGEKDLRRAKMEAGILTDMFNKMTKSCHKKCIVKEYSQDLSVGEMACIDRCVGKYIQTQEKIGFVLNQFEQQQKQIEAQGGGQTQAKLF